jgi:hypothetical protein
MRRLCTAISVVPRSWRGPPNGNVKVTLSSSDPNFASPEYSHGGRIDMQPTFSGQQDLSIDCSNEIDSTVSFSRHKLILIDSTESNSIVCRDMRHPPNQKEAIQNNSAKFIFESVPQPTDIHESHTFIAGFSSEPLTIATAR